MLIMNLGKVMGSNYERLDQFGNTQVKDFSYQLAIYIYDKGLASTSPTRDWKIARKAVCISAVPVPQTDTGR